MPLNYGFQMPVLMDWMNLRRGTLPLPSDFDIVAEIVDFDGPNPFVLEKNDAWFFFDHNYNFERNGQNLFHQGLDFNLFGGGDLGEQVYFSGSGLAYSGTANGGYGNYTIVRHDMSGFYDHALYEQGTAIYSIYEHLQFPTTFTGDDSVSSNLVNAGESAGFLGKSGDDEFHPHLHFQMYITADNQWLLPNAHRLSTDSNIGGYTTALNNSSEVVTSVDPLIFIREHSYSDNESAMNYSISRSESVEIFHRLEADVSTHDNNNSEEYVNVFGALQTGFDTDKFSVDLEGGVIYNFFLLERGLFIDTYADRPYQTPAEDLFLLPTGPFPSTVEILNETNVGDINHYSILAHEDTSFNFLVTSWSGSIGDYRLIIDALEISNQDLDEVADTLRALPDGGGGGNGISNELSDYPDGNLTLTDFSELSALALGDAVGRSLTNLSGQYSVLRLEILEIGELVIDATWWGGATSEVILISDIDSDFVFEASDAEELDRFTLDFTNTTTDRILYDIDTAQTLYLVVSAPGINGASADVTLDIALNQSGMSPPPPLPPGPSDPFTETDPGSLSDDRYPLVTDLYEVGDVDYFETNVAVAGNTYRFFASGFDNENGALDDFRMLILDENGLTVDIIAPINGLATYDLSPTASQRYTLEISSANSSVGDYSISYEDMGATPPIDDHPDNVPTSIAFNTPTDLLIGSGTDHDVFSFAGNFGHRYTISIAPSSVNGGPLTNIDLDIFNGVGTLLAEDSRTSSQSLNFQLYLYETTNVDLDVSALLGSTGHAVISVIDDGQLIPTPPSFSGASFEGTLAQQIEYLGENQFYTHNMNSNGDGFQLTANAGQTIRIITREIGNEFGSTEAVLYESGTNNALSPIFVGNLPGDGQELNFLVQTTGTYDLLVFNSSQQNDFDYEVEYAIIDDIPDTFNDLFVLDNTTTVQGILSSGSDEDVFLLNGVTGPVAITLTPASNVGGADTMLGGFLELFNSSGLKLARQFEFGTNATTLYVDITDNSEPLYLLVRDFGDTGYYEITVSPITDDHTIPVAIDLMTSASGNLETFGDVDTFHITLTGGHSYQWINSPPMGVDQANGIVVSIVDRDTNALIHSFESFVDDFSLSDYVSGSAVDISILIAHNTSSPNPNVSTDYIGAYDFAFTDITPDDYGSDYLNAEAVTTDAVFSGELEVADDLDVFNVTGLIDNATYAVNFATVGGANDLDNAVVTFLNADGSPLTTVNLDASTAGQASFIADGSTALFEISSFAEQSFGNYQFTIGFDLNHYSELNGTAANDNLIATTLDDLIYGLAGNDIINAGSGNDLVFGGEGADTLIGGAGADILDGGEGFDSADYRAASSRIAFDVVMGGTVGDADGDAFSGIERYYLSNFNDTVTGSDANEFFYGEEGNDTINAGGGIDRVYGGDGNDIQRGQEGNDTLYGSAGNDQLNGGTGFDVANYSLASAAVIVNMLTGGTGGDAAGDTYFGIEAVYGSDFDDSLTGNNSVNELRGGDGNDALFGLGGNDRFFGGDGADSFDGGTGTDTVNYTLATAGVALDLTSGGTTGEAVGDSLTSIEWVFGSGFDDSITGDAANNRLEGRDGNDTLNGEGGNDRLLGGEGNDTINGGDGVDTIFGQSGDDIMIGGAGNDFFFGDEGADSHDGGTGTDTVSYLASSTGVTVNMQTGGTGGDAAGDTYTNIERIFGSGQDDILTGSDADDILIGNGGNDFLTGGLGNDSLNGGAGVDSFAYNTDQDAADVIQGFTNNEVIDIIFTDHAFDSFAELLSVATDAGANTIFNFGSGNTLTIVGQNIADLGESNFTFTASIMAEPLGDMDVFAAEADLVDVFDMDALI
ncbi:MAG: hypothetical protein ABJN69_11005 [Hellea sp.]